MRRAWIMTLKPGCEDRYKAMHDAIWPEMREALSQNGVTSFSIFRHGLTLFAFQEREGEPLAEPLPVMWRWWKAMEPLMECHPDSRPVQTHLLEVFRFEA